MSDDDSTKPWFRIPPTGPLMRPAEAAKYLGCGRTHFYHLVKTGVLPQPIPLGPESNGATVLPKPWLDAYIAARFQSE